jgi:hypothetical protein
VGGSSQFDQNSGTFLLVGITESNSLEMIAFDTYTNTYVTGFVPDNVSEIACDNTCSREIGMLQRELKMRQHGIS